MENAESLDEVLEKIENLVEVLQAYKEMPIDKKQALQEYKEIPVDKKKQAWKYLKGKAKETVILERKNKLFSSAHSILEQTIELNKYLRNKYSNSTNPPTTIVRVVEKLISFADLFSKEIESLTKLTEQWDTLQKIDRKKHLYRTFSKLDRRLDEVVVLLSVLSEKDKTLGSATQNAENIQTQLFTSLIWSLDSLEDN